LLGNTTCSRSALPATGANAALCMRFAGPFAE
jgi:hypothetical protein